MRVLLFTVPLFLIGETSSNSPFPSRLLTRLAVSVSSSFGTALPQGADLVRRGSSGEHHAGSPSRASSTSTWGRYEAAAAAAFANNPDHTEVTSRPSGSSQHHATSPSHPASSGFSGWTQYMPAASAAERWNPEKGHEVTSKPPGHRQPGTGSGLPAGHTLAALAGQFSQQPPKKVAWNAGKT